ncbi:MAG TPA: amidohydrolase family protein [Mucilaginibacter sp.]|jgi:cytosine/adenosine deaminase-related metal-dependent hydrolase|nr:amidohydrolase family protein [Mucilaginibacter sp.]
MILNNLRTALQEAPVNIRVAGNRIAEVSVRPFHLKPDALNIDLDDAIVFPGLINSHDHLDFNLFPALGDKTYRDYTEWGQYIHQNYRKEIAEVLRIPTDLREEWGIYKNLLCGVTTVVNHGKKIQTANKHIAVYEDCQSIHSVRFEKKWKFSLNNPLKKKVAAAIHTGEGTDTLSSEEIDTLSNWNLLKRPVVGIHGVAMTKQQAKAFKALIWCPESNYFLLGRTAKIDELKEHIPILFGTDSTLTGSWDIWEHIRLAQKTGCLTDQELFDSLTINPAHTWDLSSGELSPYKNADIVIAKAGDFFSIGPEDIMLVIKNGEVRLFDEGLLSQMVHINPNNYSKVCIKGIAKYVYGQLPELMGDIKSYYPQAGFPLT